MDVVQTWIVIGVPGLIVVASLFAGRSRRRALTGYAVLLGLVVAFATVPGGAPSAAAIGILGVAYVATGRGSHRDVSESEPDEVRRRATVVRGGH